MNKPIRITDVAYAMLVELSKQSKLKPDSYMENLIHIQYKKK